MLLAKIENNIIVELIDTDSPELFPDYIEVPEHLPSNADLRFYHEDFTPKTTEELIAEGLIEPEPEPEPEPNEPEPEPEPEGLPPLTARQIRLGLVTNGISLSQVEAAIADIEDPQSKAIAEIEWEYASQFLRTHPLIEQIGAALGLTPEQIDAMWEAASHL